MNAQPRTPSTVLRLTHRPPTFATKATGDLKIPRETVAKVLNHIDHGVTKVYDRYSYDDEKRTALEAWDRYVEALVTGKIQSARVVAFGRR